MISIHDRAKIAHEALIAEPTREVLVIESQVLFSDWSTTKAAILASSFFPLKCRINEEEEGDKKKTDK